MQKAKGIKIIMHHETTSSAADYERQLDDAFSFMNKYGYTAVKLDMLVPLFQEVNIMTDNGWSIIITL